jgi:nitronate monooxygenase
MLRPSIVAAGLDPETLNEQATPEETKALFSAARATFDSAGAAPAGPQRWRDIWSAGHSVSGVAAVLPVADLVARTRAEYVEAMARSQALMRRFGVE